MGGVGWGRFVVISPLQKNAWESRIEGGVRNRKISDSSLNSGEFTFYSCEDLGLWACSSQGSKTMFTTKRTQNW